MDPQILLPRLRFLHEASHALHSQQPALSRFLLTTLADAALATSTPLPEKITKRFCSRCGSLYVPGGGGGSDIAGGTRTRVTVKKNGAVRKGDSACQRRRRGLRRGLKPKTPIDPPAAGKTDKHIVINDLGPDDAWKEEKSTLTANSKKPRTVPGKRHHRPALLTHVAYTCGFCGAETRYPGKTVKHLAQIRQNVIDVRKTQQGNVVSSEGVAPTPAVATDSQSVLPVSLKPKKGPVPAGASPVPKPAAGNIATGGPSKPSKKNKRKAELQGLLASSKKASTGEAPLSLTDFLSSL
ncbi:hypothetical protein HDU86_007049 [Geranomyces michiganensis]|nr:hypothetical protein HDU86_007049 [Geranomyces michiganensis]